MSVLLSMAIAKQSEKRGDRMASVTQQATQTQSSVIASPQGLDTTTGLNIAVGVDGGEIQYMRGNFTAQPTQISVVKAKGSLVAFGDWR